MKDPQEFGRIDRDLLHRSCCWTVIDFWLLSLIRASIQWTLLYAAVSATQAILIPILADISDIMVYVVRQDRYSSQWREFICTNEKRGDIGAICWHLGADPETGSPDFAINCFQNFRFSLVEGGEKILIGSRRRRRRSWQVVVREFRKGSWRIDSGWRWNERSSNEFTRIGWINGKGSWRILSVLADSAGSIIQSRIIFSIFFKDLDVELMAGSIIKDFKDFSRNFSGFLKGILKNPERFQEDWEGFFWIFRIF